MAEPTPTAARPIVLVPISRPQPAFPQQALRDRVTGRVIARVTVGIDGAVTAVQIESSTPPRVFDRAAVTALRQWRYAPIDQPQQTTIELDFKLE
jgi:protein TonB